MLRDKKGKKWLLIFVLLFVVDLFIEALFLFIRPMHVEFNDFISDMTGLITNYILILMLVFLIPLIYSLVSIIKYSIELHRDDKAEPILANKILSVASLAFCVALVVVLMVVFVENVVIILYVLEYYSPFLFFFLAASFLIFLYTLLDEAIFILKKKTDPFLLPKLKKYLPLTGMFLFYVGLLVLPLIFQPVYVIRGDLPEKPLIIAHRGGARFAPENTIAAAMYTNFIQADGWEIDVQISNDGVPFLMHDDTLKRTTNISETFPARQDNHASSFNISELKSLNAGNWFVSQDLYGTIADEKIPASFIDIYQEATIPTLEEVMNFSKTADLIVNVDFKSPPVTHPFFDQYFNICLGIVISANYDSKVWITSYNTEWLDLTESLAPGIVTALSRDRQDKIYYDDFNQLGYDMINSPHELPNSYFWEYDQHNIQINVWTVNMASRFQQLWALGVTSVTTDEPIVYINIDNPDLLIIKSNYILIWILSYTLIALLVVTIKLIMIKKGKYS